MTVTVPNMKRRVDKLLRKRERLGKKRISRRKARQIIRRRYKRKLDSVGRDISINEPAGVWQIVYGQRLIGGTITYANFSADRMYLMLVITIACHEIGEVTKLYFDGEEVPFSGGVVGSGSVTGDFANHVEAQVNLGDPDQAALSDMVTWTSGLTDPWTSTDRQRGRAHVGLRLKWNGSLFPNGIPNIEFLVNGGVLSDWGQEDGAGYSNNAAAIVMDYLDSMNHGPARQFDTSFSQDTDAVAICDEDVPKLGGGNEDRYEISGVFTADQAPKEILQAMLSAMDGRLLVYDHWNGLDVVAGKYQTPLDTITDDDILSELQVDVTDPLSDYFDAVRADIVSSENNWQEGPAVPYDPSGLSWPIWEEMNLPCTISHRMAQRLEKIAYNRARQETIVEADFALWTYKLKPCDTVKLTHSPLNWSDKVFEVLTTQIIIRKDTAGGQYLVNRMRLQELTSSVYDWTAASDETAVSGAVTVNYPKPQAIAASAPTSLSLASGDGYIVELDDGSLEFMIKATWTAPTDTYVHDGGYLECQYKKSADADWIEHGYEAGDATFTYVKSVEVGVDYDFRVRGVTSAGGRSSWVTASNHTVGGKTTSPSDVSSMRGEVIVA